MIESRRLRWAGHVDRMEEGGECFQNFNKYAYRRPLGRPRRRWKDNARMDFKEIHINMRNWVGSAQDRNWGPLVNAALNLRFQKPLS